jgi:glutathione peroxidase
MFIFTGMKKMSDIELETTDGAKISLENYKEKTILVVNIATRCGYTGQLDDLEKIYKKYKTKGFIVLGLPSNDFGGQTPEENKDVAKFCRLKYGTSFPILKKTSVTGATKHPIIKDLLEKTDKKEISWNFEKFLIKKDGSVQRFPSSTNPSSQTFTKAIESAL